MRHALGSAALAGFLHCGPALAQLPVTDVAANVSLTAQTISGAKQLAQQIAIVNNQITQITHLVSTVNAVAHGNVGAMADLASELGDLGLTSPLGGDMTELATALGGVAAGVGQTSTLVQGVLNADAYYMPTASDWNATKLIQGAQAVAAQKAMAQQALTAAGARLTALTKLRAGLDGNMKDIASAGQATARLAGELATGQAQSNQLMAMAAVTQAQKDTDAARTAQRLRCEADAFVKEHKEAAAQAYTGASMPLFSPATENSCATAALAQAQAAAAAAVQQASAGTTAAGLAANYQSYLGQAVNGGQCVALVQAATPDLGLTRTWVQGQAVQGADIPVGTPIATFDADGTYGNHTDGSSHAAIYLGQNADGIQVEDQWAGQPAHLRTIAWSGGANGTAANTGTAFHVIAHSSSS